MKLKRRVIKHEEGNETGGPENYWGQSYAEALRKLEKKVETTNPLSTKGLNQMSKKLHLK